MTTSAPITGPLSSTTLRIVKTATNTSGVGSAQEATVVRSALATETTAKKDFATVAAEARAKLDAGYQTLGKTGDVHTSGKDWKAAFGDMDRRSLYAVSSNAGGHFTADEQGAASALMEQQFEAAQGIDASNPASMTAFQNNMAAGTKAGIAFLDSVSDEEKQSVGWAASRASMQNFYSIVASKDGQQPEDVDSDNPLVKVLASAMKASRGDPGRDRSEGRMDTLEGLMSQPWAKGFEAQIEQASRAVAKQGSLVDKTV